MRSSSGYINPYLFRIHQCWPRNHQLLNLLWETDGEAYRARATGGSGSEDVRRRACPAPCTHTTRTARARHTRREKERPRGRRLGRAEGPDSENERGSRRGLTVVRDRPLARTELRRGRLDPGHNDHGSLILVGVSEPHAARTRRG